MSKLNPKKVNEIIERFEFKAKQELGALMQDSKDLSVQYYFYCDAVGDLGRKYRTARVERKNLFATLKNRFIKNDKVSAAAAEAETTANEEYQAAYKAEYEFEGRYQKGKLLSGAIAKILDAMRQEVAELRKERDNTSTNGGNYNG